MFGGSSSPPKEKVDTISNPSASLGASPAEAEDGSAAREKSNNSSSLPPTRKPSDGANTTPALEKKRRSSSVAKAASFFTNAKNSLHLSSSPRGSTNIQPVLTPLQKLSKMDPALGVPQGSLNNSAGESMPTPRSSFRVGVTEDKNRKCRRTMEDTHAYLYNFLGTPVPTPALSSSNGNESSHSVVSSASEESTHVVETDNGYFAIFDGHAGTFAAEWCGKKLHLILEEIMRKHPNTPVPELLDQTFTSVDQQLEKLPLKNSGCTAVTAVLRWEDRIPSTVSATGSSNIAPAATVEKPETDGESPNTPTQASTQSTDAETSAPPPPPTLKEKANRQRVLYTANVGDARVVLCRSGKALRLSYDHKGSDDNEGKRIMSAGGLILNNRVNGVLAVTRALGDTYLKDLVTGHPYTTETVIQPDVDEFLILACDGLWDVCSDQEAVDLVRNIQDPQVASKVLVDHALARFSTDNLSCMIVRLDSKLIQSMVEHLVEPIGVEGDPPTKKKGGVSEADKIVSEARKSIGSSPDDENPLENSKLHEEMEQQASNEELGPEVTPGEVPRLPDVAELDVQNKAKIKDDDKGPDIAGDKEK